MNINSLHVGASLEVFSVTEVGERISFRTKLEEFIEPSLISVWANDVLPRYTAAAEHEIFYRHNGEDHMWIGENRGIAHSKDGFIVFKLFVRKEESTNASRREHFRVTYMVNAEVQYLDREARKTVTEPADLVDISAGGVAFLSACVLEPGGNGRLTFRLDRENITLPFNIVAREEMPPGFRVPYRYRCRWETLSVAFEEKIVRFVFQKQRDSMKRD